MLICDKCGQTYAQGKFCKNCGGQLHDFFSVAAANDNAPVSKCAKCGKTFTEGKFCIYCGSELDVMKTEPTVPAKPVFRCEGCGAEFEGGKFCKKCGSPLKQVGGENIQAEPIVNAAAVSDAAPDNTPKPQDIIPQSPRTFDINDTATQPAPAATGLKCPDCGKLFEKGKFCTVCGGTLVPVDDAKPETETLPEIIIPDITPEVKNDEPQVNSPAASTDMLQCPQCGKTFEKGKFCTVCGGTLQPMGLANNQQAADTPDTSADSFNTYEESAIQHQAQSFSAPVNDSAPMLKCPQCGKTFEKGKFCTVCGGTLEPVNTAPKPQAPVFTPNIQQPAPQAPMQSVNNSPAPNTAPNGGPTKLRCTSCGNVMEKGKFCTVCGGSLEPIGGAPAPQQAMPNINPVMPTAGGMLRCESCGKTFEKGKFCTVCGGNLIPN